MVKETLTTIVALVFGVGLYFIGCVLAVLPLYLGFKILTAIF